MQSLAPKPDFLGLDSVAYLATGGECPTLRSHFDVFAWFAERKSEGMAGREAIVGATEAAKDEVGRLLGVDGESIGFGQSVAQAANMVIHSLELREGDNIVMEAWEYPSMMFPWYRVRQSGVEVRLVGGAPWRASLEQISAAVDSRTRAIALSHSSYFTGELHDLAAYRALADSVDALLLVDASHTVGALTVDASQADFLFSCCYKWVLGVHGVGIAFWNRERQPLWQPREAGWYSAEWQDAQVRRDPPKLLEDGHVFELGNPSFLGACILGNAASYLVRLGTAAVERHVLSLSGLLRDRLAGLGVELLTPGEPGRRAGNVAFEVGDEGAWRQGLEERGVLAWTSDSRVRLSTHIFNDSADVERSVAAVEDLLSAVGQGKPEPTAGSRRD